MEKVAELNQQVEELKQERKKILKLNDLSLKQIELHEKKRLAAERAEQIRIKADSLELQALYNHKLEKIKQQQRFIWDGYIDKEYKELTTTDGRTYTKGKVIDVNAAGISLQHDNGISRIPFALFGEETEKLTIGDFEKQIESIKRWLHIEGEERKIIRNQAKLDAEAEFKSEK